MLQIFLATLLGGCVFILLPPFKPHIFKIILAFTGSYLFALTVLHLLPDLFKVPTHTHSIGLFILAGFFLQVILGAFSEGIEHGHLHEGHHHKLLISPTRVFISLYIHALLDGVIINNATLGCSCQMHHHSQHAHTPIYGWLMGGIMLHKFCDAFALVSVLNQVLRSKKAIFLYLLGFSMASPLGFWLSNAGHSKIFSPQVYVMLSAIAVGNLLQISTTIFFEACPHHKIDFKRFLAMMLGVLAVVMMEFFL